MPSMLNTIILSPLYLGYQFIFLFFKSTHCSDSDYSQAVVDAFTGLMVAVATNCTLQENILLYQRLCGFTLWLSGYPTLLSAYILTLISIDRAHCVMSSPLADRR